MARGIPHPDCKNYGEKLVYDYPLVLVSEKPILSIESIVPALELAKKARKQLLIITCDFSEAVLSTLIYNKRKKIVEACAIKLTDYGTKYQNLLKDIAEATGAYIFDQYN